MRTLARIPRRRRRGSAVRTLNWSHGPASRGHPQRWLLDLQRTLGNQSVRDLVQTFPDKIELAARRPDGIQWLAAAARASRAKTSEKRPEPPPSRIETRTTVERYPFSATIWRGPSGPQGGQASAPAGRLDAPPGQETDEGKLQNTLNQLIEAQSGTAQTETTPTEPSATEATATEASATEATTATEATATETIGQPISVPVIQDPILAQIEKSDAVGGSFEYSGTITRGGAQPRGFGVTRSFGSRLSGVTITPNSGTYQVSATYEHPITYQVRSGTGPDSQVDIASETDDSITQANYETVVSDLTPDMSDLNGRPPRTQFWAEDLTLRHELVHANDDMSNGPGAVRTITEWLNGRTAGSEGAVRLLLDQLPRRFASALLAALSTEEGENRAYGDGAPSYQTRANAIKTKGDASEYP